MLLCALFALLRLRGYVSACALACDHGIPSEKCVLAWFLCACARAVCACTPTCMRVCVRVCVLVCDCMPADRLRFLVCRCCVRLIVHARACEQMLCEPDDMHACLMRVI